jgi:putative transcriptional regulator
MVGMNVRELRTATGMTQKEFADYFHIPFRTLQNWEGGQRKAPEYLVKLIEYKLKMEGIIM